jgi:hypothetical protein
MMVQRRKNPPHPLGNPGDYDLKILGFFYDDCVFFTNFDATFTTQTLFSVNGLGFVVLHLEDIYGTDFNTFLTPLTFFLVDFYLVSHLVFPLYLDLMIY